MDRFDAMRLFVRIVDLQSFTKAADDLQLPRATVTHALQLLEKRLGVRLLHRTTRHVSATLDGEAYYQRCQQLLADLEEAESAFSNVAANPKGKLRVDLQGTLAMHFLLPHIGEFFARYPEIELEIGLGDRLADLVRERVDCVPASRATRAWWAGASRCWSSSPAPAPTIWQSRASRPRWKPFAPTGP